MTGHRSGIRTPVVDVGVPLALYDVLRGAGASVCLAYRAHGPRQLIMARAHEAAA
jgi:hypothetical protein